MRRTSPIPGLRAGSPGALRASGTRLAPSILAVAGLVVASHAIVTARAADDAAGASPSQQAPQTEAARDATRVLAGVEGGADAPRNRVRSDAGPQGPEGGQPHTDDPPGPSGAENAEAVFRRAGADYEAGRYEEAARLYESLLSSGYDDAKIHYNLGNARFKQGRLGLANLAYERALVRDPSDADARENLAYATLLITDKVGTAEDEFPAAILDVLGRQADRVVAALAVVSAVSGLIGIGLWFDPRRRTARRLLRGALVILLPVAILLGVMAGLGIASAGRTEYAVVLADSADGRSAPVDNGTVLFTVHQGLKVEVRGSRPGWLQIVLPNGLTGWIEDGKAERIRP